MSREAAAKFFEALQHDDALSNALANSGLERDGTVWGNELLQFASSKGYDFTQEELQEHLPVQPNADTGEELSDASLEAVAGGAGSLSLLDPRSAIYKINTSTTSFRISPIAQCVAECGW